MVQDLQHVSHDPDWHERKEAAEAAEQSKTGPVQDALDRAETAISDDGTVWDPESDIPDYAFASRYSSKPVPQKQLANHAFHAAEAYQIIKDLRQLDQNPRMNLASFVTTWMEPEAEKVMVEALNVNFVDAEQYRSCQEMQRRCLNMVASLYNSPDAEASPGAACVGSSEAIMLGALSMKKKWMERRVAQGKSTAKPNMVMGHNVQVCWEKFLKYFDVEGKFVPLTPDCFTLTAAGARELVDENTIGICGILGSTYNGEYEDIEALDKLSDELREEHGWEVPIHVDAASGGFVAPFVTPDLKWDFRLKNVVSINVSGHKYGLVYAGIGWVVFRNKDALHKDLIFSTNYLGSDQPNITLNFSRGAANVVAQYYQFLRLGFNGYRSVMRNLMKMTKLLRVGVESLGMFRLLSNDHSLPLVAFAIKPKTTESGEEVGRIWNEYELADKLRERNWVLPAYSMAPNAEEVTLLRIVVREDMSVSMVESLIKDLKWAVDWLEAHFVFTRDEVSHLRQKFHDQLRLSSIARGRHCH